MTRSFFVLAALAIIACGGSTGPQGPQGSPGPSGPPFNRATSYCTTAGVAASGAPGILVATTTCLQVADIPIQGWCHDGETLPAGVFLDSGPGIVGWNDTTQPAAWTCTWSWTAGTPPPPAAFPGTAEICCAKPQ